MSAGMPLKEKAVSSSVDEAALCRDLLARVAAIREELISTTAESEAGQQLSPRSLALLKANDLLNMRLMRENGGMEASIATQCKVLAALAEADSATAWCAMVHNNGVGTIAAYFPSSALTEIFRNGIPVVANLAAPTGVARKVDGGYSVTGSWRFCSGYHNADWIVCVAREEEGGQELLIALPKKDAVPLDTWNVFGLRGTGSIDFSLRDYFLPQDRAVDNSMRIQLRGTRIYSRPGILIAAYEHAAFAWGLGRRSLRLLTEQAARLGANLAARETVAAEISKLTLQLEGAARVMLDYYDHLETLDIDESADPTLATRGRAIAAHVTDVAATCAEAAFRRAGTRAAFLPNPIETTLRDIKVAQAHVIVGDSAYALHGMALVDAHVADAQA